MIWETGLPMKVNVCKSINIESYLIIIQVLEEEYAQFFTTVLGWKISLKVQLHLNKVLMWTKICQKRENLDNFFSPRLVFVPVALDHSMVPGPYHRNSLVENDDTKQKTYLFNQIQLKIQISFTSSAWQMKFLKKLLSISEVDKYPVHSVAGRNHKYKYNSG